MTTNNTQEQAAKATGWLTNLLTGWGVPGSIARIAAGAIIGALAAAYALLNTSCTVDYTQTAAGDTSYHGSIIPVMEDTAK